MAAALLTLFQRSARLPGPAAGADRAALPVSVPRALPRWLVPVALVALLMFVRRPDHWLDPQFFQEDGVFFEQNYHHGWSAFFLPYAGYLCMVMRLVGPS